MKVCISLMDSSYASMTNTFSSYLQQLDNVLEEIRCLWQIINAPYPLLCRFSYTLELFEIIPTNIFYFFFTFENKYNSGRPERST